MKLTSACTCSPSVLNISKHLLTNQHFPRNRITTDLCNPIAEIIKILTNKKALQSSVFLIYIKHVTSKYQHRFCSFRTFTVLQSKNFKTEQKFRRC